MLMNYHNFISKSFGVMALTAVSLSANALDKPQTMEDMWKIIQAQQQQLNAMQARLEKAESKPVVASVQQPTQSAEAKVSSTLASNSQSPEPQAPNTQVKKLERKTDILSQEVEKLRTNLAIPEEKQLKSAYGLGPAASKVYQVGKGLSIGGYGEGFYQNIVGDKGTENLKPIWNVW